MNVMHEERTERKLPHWPRDYSPEVETLSVHHRADRGPALDLLDREREVILRIDLPGLGQEHVEIRTDGNELTIAGFRATQDDPVGATYRTRERWSGTFSRTVTLPESANTGRLEVSSRHGVLEIRIGKRA